MSPSVRVVLEDTQAPISFGNCKKSSIALILKYSNIKLLEFFISTLYQNKEKQKNRLNPIFFGGNCK